jgi:hypothetical protein
VLFRIAFQALDISAVVKETLLAEQTPCCFALIRIDITTIAVLDGRETPRKTF